jgi:hypothetical protein
MGHDLRRRRASERRLLRVRLSLPAGTLIQTRPALHPRARCRLSFRPIPRPGYQLPWQQQARSQMVFHCCSFLHRWLRRRRLGHTVASLWLNLWRTERRSLWDTASLFDALRICRYNFVSFVAHIFLDKNKADSTTPAINRMPLDQLKIVVNRLGVPALSLACCPMSCSSNAVRFAKMLVRKDPRVVMIPRIQAIHAMWRSHTEWIFTFDPIIWLYRAAETLIPRGCKVRRALSYSNSIRSITS